jgi:hypothetical protein
MRFTAKIKDTKKKINLESADEAVTSVYFEIDWTRKFFQDELVDIEKVEDENIS